MQKKWLIIAMLFPVLSFSQNDKAGPGFHTIVSAGAVAGKSFVKPIGQLSSGFTYDRFFTGIGVGIDYYRYRSIPLFADWRMNFGHRQAVFLFANGGYNFSYGNEPKNQAAFSTTNQFHGGLYFDTGIGYRMRLTTSHHLLFSAGYGQKNIVNEVGYNYPCFNPPCNEEVVKYHYNFGRISTKLSWEFGK